MGVLVSVFDMVPVRPKRATSTLDLAAASARIACRAEMMLDLMRETSSPQRDAIRRLWVLSKCKTCGECADMVAR